MSQSYEPELLQKMDKMLLELDSIKKVQAACEQKLDQVDKSVQARLYEHKQQVQEVHETFIARVKDFIGIHVNPAPSAGNIVAPASSSAELAERLKELCADGVRELCSLAEQPQSTGVMASINALKGKMEVYREAKTADLVAREDPYLQGQYNYLKGAWVSLQQRLCLAQTKASPAKGKTAYA